MLGAHALYDSKNNHDTELTKEYLDEYMELFINFKLKVKDKLGIGTVKIICEKNIKKQNKMVCF